MENNLRKLDVIQEQNNWNSISIKKAMSTNQKHEDVKIIYLKLKELQKEVKVLMEASKCSSNRNAMHVK